MDSIRSPSRSTTTAVQTFSLTQPIAVPEKKMMPSKRSSSKNRSKRKMESRNRSKIQNAGLIKLPQEIKNRIYELVLGGNLLHISRDTIKFERKVVHSTKGDIKEQRFTHRICCSRISEEDAQHGFDIEEEGRNMYVEGTELRHSACYPSRPKGSVPLRLDISLLHSCRQVYSEARFIPYSTNTFSFDVPRTLRAFVHLLLQRGVNFNQAVRSLCLDLSHNNHDLHGWTQAFNAVTKHMILLNRVSINVDQRPNWSKTHDPVQKEAAMRPVLECLAILGKTPAKSTTIVVSDRYLTKRTDLDNIWLSNRWTMVEKRMWVAEVKLAMRDVRSSS